MWRLSGGGAGGGAPAEAVAEGRRETDLPVDGVPTPSKDLLRTSGWPTLRGSKTIDPAGPWDQETRTAVARLREAAGGAGRPAPHAGNSAGRG